MRFIGLFLVVIIFQSSTQAYVAGEVRPGIIELRSESKNGMVVSHLTTAQRGKKNWVYFCVVNKGPRRKQRCFYAREKQYADLRTGRVLQRIEYALRPRIQNKHGRIAIGSRRYFYPVKDLGPRAP